jgi:hypothetical protein
VRAAFATRFLKAASGSAVSVTTGDYEPQPGVC